MKTWGRALRNFVFVSILLGVQVTAHAGMQEDMVKFDQVYIPALSLSNQGKPQTAAAMDRLLETWSWFKQSYAYSNSGDSQWNFDMTQIENQLMEAQRLIERKAYPDAHEALESVRFTLMGMRERIGMAYFIDELIRFHQPMEDIALKAKAAAKAGLSDADIDAIKQDYLQAREKWDVVLNWNFNPYDYGMDIAQGEKLHKQLMLEDQALRQLGQALAGSDRKAIAQAAAGIKPPFVPCYLSFGRFPST